MRGNWLALTAWPVPQQAGRGRLRSRLLPSPPSRLGRTVVAWYANTSLMVRSLSLAPVGRRPPGGGAIQSMGPASSLPHRRVPCRGWQG